MKFSSNLVSLLAAASVAVAETTDASLISSLIGEFEKNPAATGAALDAVIDLAQALEIDALAYPDQYTSYVSQLEALTAIVDDEDLSQVPVAIAAITALPFADRLYQEAAAYATNTGSEFSVSLTGSYSTDNINWSTFWDDGYSATESGVDVYATESGISQGLESDISDASAVAASSAKTSSAGSSSGSSSDSASSASSSEASSSSSAQAASFGVYLYSGVFSAAGLALLMI
ncbi:hypothetical protein OGAPHI_002990 [Ogataea philodendri]|uniref:Uncharacterized protein n=1 Tax=Ogataea philodendri TaxID=1378263 RepID=A0A9P8T6W2_9ASCO|nr:uncharacterized protein OGAPHI_002990 [Ogataea philodendri]KAH3667341.1 hypothetical protein OGAPHI_002990 [Ogataea philodendri]